MLRASNKILGCAGATLFELALHPVDTTHPAAQVLCRSTTLQAGGDMGATLQVAIEVAKPGLDMSLTAIAKVRLTRHTISLVPLPGRYLLYLCSLPLSLTKWAVITSLEPAGDAV